MTAPDSTIADAIAALESALKEPLQDVLPVTSDPGLSITRPTLVIPPPDMTWEAFNNPYPTALTFTLAIVVPRDGREMAHLYALIPRVAAAVQQHTDASMGRAEPGQWTASGTRLPAYLIEIEGSLT